MLEFLFDTTRCVIDLILSGAVARYPAIRWIVPHAGAVLPVVAHRVAGFSALFGSFEDVPAVLGTFYYDLAGMPLPVALDALLALVKPERLLYGSDFPFTPAPVVVGMAEAIASSSALTSADLTTAADSAATLFPRLAEASARC
jgi:predicted TIM-barrel fold metal-dependent hydrolase